MNETKLKSMLNSIGSGCLLQTSETPSELCFNFNGTLYNDSKHRGNAGPLLPFTGAEETVTEALDLSLRKVRPHEQDVEYLSEGKAEAIDLSAEKARRSLETFIKPAVTYEAELPRKRCHNDGVNRSCKPAENHNDVFFQPRSPGPFLGTTRLIEIKQPRLADDRGLPAITFVSSSLQINDRETEIIDASQENKLFTTEFNNISNSKIITSSSLVVSARLTPSIFSTNCPNLNPISKETSAFELETIIHNDKRNDITLRADNLAAPSGKIARATKSYGHLYINGYVYTYLSFVCTTELFYCTFDRPQPAYVRHRAGFSLYSNWKICKTVMSSVELGRCVFRHLPAGYTLAKSRAEDILTYSSQRTNISSDSLIKLESSQSRDKIQCEDGLKNSHQLQFNDNSNVKSTVDQHEQNRNISTCDCPMLNRQESSVKCQVINSKHQLKSELFPFDESSNGNRRTIVTGEPESFLVSSQSTNNYKRITEDARSICKVCNKVFNKSSQLRLHMNIHYFERQFRCESCGISFRTKNLLLKHERSSLHRNMTIATPRPTTTNDPRPFKCSECELAFRIHGHLAKHFRSKMHIMKLECLQKLPFGSCAELEKAGANLNDIDTTNCDTSLSSLRIMTQQLFTKDHSKI